MNGSHEKQSRVSDRSWGLQRWLAPFVVALIWSLSSALTLVVDGRARFLVYFGVVTFGSLATLVVFEIHRRIRWVDPSRRLAAEISRFELQPEYFPTFTTSPVLNELSKALTSLSRSYQRLLKSTPSKTPFLGSPSDSHYGGVKVPMTSSGLYDYPSDLFMASNFGQLSGEHIQTEMVNRLEPGLWRWLESSPAEQEFLGWNLERLREKSFLEIVPPDDLARVREQLRASLVKGEVHGLVLRIRTRHGKPKAIEMNVATRHGPDHSVSHIRCHITDVTAKVRSERELRLRTRELTQVNEQLRMINRELEDLKERYRDLYQNAPAMYFSLNEERMIVDCNDTLLLTLGYGRLEVVGQPYHRILPESHRARSEERFEQFREQGSIEVETQWQKANGEVIDVWVTGSAVRAGDGRIIQTRSVAQDVTARHRLEAELQLKNKGLAAANVELSRRNKEMDEFTYVVSHDLQEPLRTLIAFSDFLLRDYGDRLDENGKEFVLYLVNASRRMRALIQDLLKLSRAGKVTSEFLEVDLGELVATVRSDLAELVRSRNAELLVDGAPPRIWGDPSRLGQLIANLISNGIKYNDKAVPKVEIRFSEAESNVVEIAIADNGIGIEPQFHDKIFQLFKRLHTQEEYEGTGAGLAIANKIVQAHGGKIRLESKVKVGSTFFVSLPRIVPTPIRDNQSEEHS